MYPVRRHSRSGFAIGRAWHRLQLLMMAVLALTIGVGAQTARAQVSLIVEGPPGPVLPNITPRFIMTVRGLPTSAQPLLLYTLLISRTPTFDGAFIETINATSTDTVVGAIVTRPLPNGDLGKPLSVYWKARVTLPNGTVVESDVTGPREVPLWLALVSPNSGLGDGEFKTRRPRFVWRSAKIDPLFGFWTYAIQVSDKNGVKLSASPLRDTTYVPTDSLEANTLYHWQLQATVEPTKDAVTVSSVSTFLISDPSVPTTTLLYQNFPNPFPSPLSLSTCFWFDVRVGGARVALDILDQRGSLVKRVIPPADFPAGTYGRGQEGGGSNCDNKYVWNGSATDGHFVPGGIYLARFTATGSLPLFKKIVFRGR
ncbi:MAG: hypothetical protein ABJB74_22920 [Gemmatimonas sp.]